MSPYWRVARVLLVLALVLIGLLLAMPMETLDGQYRKMTLVFSAGLFLAAIISLGVGFVRGPHSSDS